MTRTDPEPDAEPPADAQIDLVATVGPLDATVVVLRELLHAAGANRAIAVVEGGIGRHDLTEPAIVDVERLQPIEVTIGEHVVHMPHSIELDAPTPAMPEFKNLPPFDADPETGDIAAPLGGVEHRAIRARTAAELLDERTVLQLHWDTLRAGVAFSITVRSGVAEPVVLGIGEETFPMPPGWPDTPITTSSES